jgi:hypothetical protein
MNNAASHDDKGMVVTELFVRYNDIANFGSTTITVKLEVVSVIELEVVSIMELTPPLRNGWVVDAVAAVMSPRNTSLQQF